jgi:2-polyprenyl-3-methyl-5-hydroxy-6-metoxy-1,4-benzoquinol methylase
MPIPVERCPACQSAEFRPRYRFDQCAIVRCRPCGFMWLDPRPTPEDTSVLYDDHYFGNELLLDGTSRHLYGYVDYVSERINKQIRYTDLVSQVRARLGGAREAPLRWLDVGCGFGYLLDCAFDGGFVPCGVEFNRHAVDRIRAKYTFDVRHGSLGDTGWEPRSFDVVSMMDVIEHLHDPWETVDGAARVLRPGGVLLVTTMDSDSVVSRILGPRLEDFRRTREHLYFFSRKTLAALLEKSGFEVLGVESYGHTFELAFLMERVKLISRLAGTALLQGVRALGLSRARIYVDPHTKMLMTARIR